MQIRFLDLRRQYREVETETNAALTRVLATGAYVLGAEVEAFEAEWASFCGVRGAVTTNSGTDALALALIASGAVRPGKQDEVITSPLTAGYTALAIMSAGGVPVFADIDPLTYTIDPEAVRKAITPRTRAIVPVHLYGRMADMGGICRIAAEPGLLVIEDAAQAHGATAFGKFAGEYGYAAAFSFYPTKNLGAYGDGGAVTSNDEGLIERVKDLRQGGHPAALGANLLGRNSRLDEMQAALLRVKLKNLTKWNLKREHLAGIYSEELSGCVSIKLPEPAERGSDVHHLFVIEHPAREALRAHLSACGIETMIHYPLLLHQQPLFRRPGQKALPVAERVASRILSLPLYPQLQEQEVRAVAKAIVEFENSN